MNFEHAYANMLMAMVASGTCLGCLGIAEHYDNFVVMYGRKRLWVKLCVVSSVVACAIKVDIWQSLGVGIVLGALLFACITDYVQCQVYHFTWWIAGNVEMVWILFAMCRGEQLSWLELILFCMMQELFFSKLYGRADCHAFCVCAVMYALLEKGMLCYFLHMAMALLLLACIQLRRRNIARSGNLKTPVAFIPYIVLAFIVLYIVITCELGREML